MASARNVKEDSKENSHHPPLIPGNGEPQKPVLTVPIDAHGLISWNTSEKRKEELLEAVGSLQPSDPDTIRVIDGVLEKLQNQLPKFRGPTLIPKGLNGLEQLNAWKISSERPNMKPVPVTHCCKMAFVSFLNGDVESFCMAVCHAVLEQDEFLAAKRKRCCTGEELQREVYHEL